MSQKDDPKKPNLKAVELEKHGECDEDICNDCRAKMEGPEHCPGCGDELTDENRCDGDCEDCEHVEECYEEMQQQEAQEQEDEFFSMFFNNCILMENDKGKKIPFALISGEGRVFIGGLLYMRPDGRYGLVNPLQYVEVLRNKTAELAMIRPYQGTGLPPVILVKASSVILLRADSAKDRSLAQSYNDVLKRFSAEDAGIILPDGPLSGKN